MNFFRLMLLIVCFILNTVSVYAQAELIEAFPNLSFIRPVDLQSANDDANRIFVVEQQGIIYVFDNDSAVAQKSEFINLKDEVNDSGNEEGLLGLAFHPDYKNNGYFFVDYTASSPRRTVISRFKVSDANPDSAAKVSELIILEIPQPESNHNGGQIAFGPDGYLYIAMGDGGGSGDQHGTTGNGQDLTTLLGSILRIDVNQVSDTMNYAIPADNPFSNNQSGYKEEIYAFGLRNPWRFSFDSVTGLLWAADVGQNAYEEIDIIAKGNNYGWRVMEASHCYNPSSGCDTTGLTFPIWEYGRSSGASVSGGYVYRGKSVPELQGKYIYADYVSGRIWSLLYDGLNPAVNSLLIDTSVNISSFGLDQDNELYICAFDGKIYRFKPTVTTSIDDPSVLQPAEFILEPNYPNPFNPGTVIPFTVNRLSDLEMNIYSIGGQLVKNMVRNTFNAGRYTVYWNGKNENGQLVPSGVYFVRLRSDKAMTTTRRMLLLK